MTLRMSCSKSNSNTSYGSHEVRNQVETQKERSQLTSIQQDSLHYFPGGGGGGGGGAENNDFKNELLLIQF